MTDFNKQAKNLHRNYIGIEINPDYSERWRDLFKDVIDLGKIALLNILDKTKEEE